MQKTGYNPYHGGANRRKHSFKLPKPASGPAWKRAKKWLKIILGVLIGLIIIFYLSLGELRVFANNFLRLGFFHKDYLIVLQNNYELRPGGGFVTGYGELGITLGNPSDIKFFNSYEIDTDKYVTPPFPHEKLLKNEWYEGYTFRDANWDPNFPDSAETLINFYLQKFPDKDVDGVIVVNYNVIENLIDKLGGIDINGELLTKDNMFKNITDTVNDVDRHNEQALIDRKDVLGEIAANIIPKAKWHPFKTKSVITEALANKDIYFWFASPGMQKKMEKRGWANAITAGENADFLAVNIANLGSKKADRYVTKEVYHNVNIRKEIPEVTTEIVIRYPGSKNIYADDYKGFLRVYIPANAEIKSDLLGAVTETIGDFKVISTEFILPAGGKTSIFYTYELARTLLPANKYSLRLIKQSGDNKRYNITVESREDSVMQSDDFDTRENKAKWEGYLKNDLDLNITVLADTSSPYPIEQVFESLNSIAVYWNEPISEAYGNDALNYNIVDADIKNPSITDNITVTYAEVVDASVTKLELEGITKQDLERYTIRISNIQDSAGNAIDPDPKIVTAVQRIASPSLEGLEKID